MKITDYITYLEPMKRWREYWTARVGELEATGKTREEATTALFRKVEQGYAGNYTPLVIPHCGYIAHTWPEDGQHLLALGRGGPLRLSGQVER